MIEINKFQEGVLHKFFEDKHSICVAARGNASDGKSEQGVNVLYDEAMQLVDFGLAVDASSLPKFKKIVKDFEKEEGREISVLIPSKLAELMFKGSVSRTVN